LLTRFTRNRLEIPSYQNLNLSAMQETIG
jgi:hypothetical protein